MNEVDYIKRKLKEDIATDFKNVLVITKLILPISNTKHDQLLLLESQFNENQTKRIQGIISNEEDRLTINKLTKSLLDIINSLTEKDLLSKESPLGNLTAIEHHSDIKHNSFVCKLIYKNGENFAFNILFDNKEYILEHIIIQPTWTESGKRILKLNEKTVPHTEGPSKMVKGTLFSFYSSYHRKFAFKITFEDYVTYGEIEYIEKNDSLTSLMLNIRGETLFADNVKNIFNI